MKKLTLLVGLSILPSVLHARPEFLARYMADPFARPEKSNCSTCHVSAAGGGARNPFGQAFAAAGFQITPALKQKFPDWFLATKSAQAAGTTVKAVWSASKDNETVVQIGEDSYLLNRAEGTIVKIDAQQLAAFSAPATGAPAGGGAQPIAASKPADDLDSKTLATFDNYLINLPTNRERPAHSLLMRFTHRFDLPIAGKTGALRDLFGFDSTSSVSSFGIEGAVNKWLALTAYRMPIRGLQTIEMGAHLSLLRQSATVPIALSMRTTIEGQRNFTERFSENFQPVISHSFGSVFEVFVVPTFSVNVPRRTLTFDFAATPGEARDNAGAIGLGGSLRIRPKVALTAEWYPRVYGFRGEGSSNSYAFGIERRTHRHVFGLIVTNNSYTTTTRSIISGQGDLRVGFNLSRRLF